MRYEPANAWHFQTEIAGGSSSKHFVETVRNLGCFDPSADTIKTDLRESNSAATAEAKKEAFATIFHSRQPFSYKEYATTSCAEPQQTVLSQQLYSATAMMRMLFDMALDNYENKGKSRSRNLSRPSPAQLPQQLQPAAQLSLSISSEESTEDKRRSVSSSAGLHTNSIYFFVIS